MFNAILANVMSQMNVSECRVFTTEALMAAIIKEQSHIGTKLESVLINKQLWINLFIAYNENFNLFMEIKILLFEFLCNH